MARINWLEALRGLASIGWKPFGGSPQLAGVPTLFILGKTVNEYEDEAPGGVYYASTQFPIRPAFAMTITKGQGQSAYYAGLDLTHDVFAHGQQYTAWSRATSGKRFRVFAPNREKDERGYVRVLNVVAKQLNLE